MSAWIFLAVFAAGVVLRAPGLTDLPLSAAEALAPAPAALGFLEDAESARWAALLLVALGGALLAHAAARRLGPAVGAAVGWMALADPLAALAAREAGPGAPLYLGGALLAASALSEPEHRLRRLLGAGGLVFLLLSLPTELSGAATPPPDAVFWVWAARVPAAVAPPLAWLHELGFAPPAAACAGFLLARRRGAVPRLGLLLLALLASEGATPHRLSALAALSPLVLEGLSLLLADLGRRDRAPPWMLAGLLVAVLVPTLLPDLRSSHRFPWPAALAELGPGARVVAPLEDWVSAEARRLGRRDLDVLPLDSGAPAGPSRDAVVLLPVVSDHAWPPAASAALAALEGARLPDAEFRVRRFDLYRYELRRFSPQAGR